MEKSPLLRAILCGSAAVASGPVTAQDYGDPSGRALTVVGDVRIVAADGERSWIDGGFGKSRFGPDQSRPARRLRSDIVPVEGDLVWSPSIDWRFGTTFAATAQDGQEHPVDLSEAFITYRHDPIGVVRLSARAGLFWPPVSLEHSGPEWAVTETITPSAINSWIGEEVKVGAAEASASLPLGQGRITATIAIFGLNDTSGTLIAYRGWALHDQKATAFGRQLLPPLDPFSLFVQAAATRPVIELDNRPGYYLRLGWTPSEHVKLHAFYYDNRANPEAVTPTLQWGWRTHFVEAGGVVTLGTGTRLTVQGLAGRTVEGFPMPTRLWSDTGFRSAFALITQSWGKPERGGSVSGRVEAFGTTSRGSVLGADESEHGWGATFAARRAFGSHVTVLGEVQHIDSRRAARLRGRLDPRQAQTVVQLALRLRR